MTAMNPQVIETTQRPSIISSWHSALIAIASFSYVLVSFGFTGVPSVSRIALISACAILTLLTFSFNKLKIPYWIVLWSALYLYLALYSLVLEKVYYDMLGMMVATFVGTLAISLAVLNRRVSYSIIVYAAICASIINIIAVSMGIETSQDFEDGRFSGLIGNPNGLCIRMALTSFLIWLFPEKFCWFVKLASFPIIFYGMYITGSRKGLVYCAAFVLLILVDQIARTKLSRLVLYGSIITACLVAAQENLQATAVKYTSTITAVERAKIAINGHETSYDSRIRLMNTGIKIWKESPVWGHGFYQFANLSGYKTYSHNNYIELAVSGGVIALVLFYSVHAIILKKSIALNLSCMLRVFIFLTAILFVDCAVVSFYDKAVMCSLGTLLAYISVPKMKVQ